MTLLGLDVGTSELKAAAYDACGASLAQSAVEYHASRPEPGRYELAADVLWSAVCEAIRRVTAGCGEPVRALAISCQGESFIAVDSQGKALLPFILNLDGRAAAESADYARSIGRQRLYEITGLPPHPMYTLPKIAWIRKSLPEVFARADRFLCVHDYLVHRLAGEAIIDGSLASRTLGLDLAAGCWSPELLAHAGLSEKRLARVAQAGTPIGTVPSQLARELGLAPGALCVCGGHDQACTALGAGSTLPGSAVDGAGTFEAILLALDEPLLSPVTLAAHLPCERHLIPGRFLTIAYVPGGIMLRWLRDQCARELAAQAERSGKNPYDLLLAGVSDEPTGLLVYPYLIGTGTPWMEPSVRCSIHGLTLDTTREQMAKGALEGVCLEMRCNLEILSSLGIGVQRVCAAGGGAKSPLWLQLKADVWGCEVVTVPVEAGCLGAAICAGIGAGVYTSWEEAVAATRRFGAVYQPRPALHRQYTERFEHYKSLAGSTYGWRTARG